MLRYHVCYFENNFFKLTLIHYGCLIIFNYSLTDIGVYKLFENYKILKPLLRMYFIVQIHVKFKFFKNFQCKTMNTCYIFK